LGGFRTSFKDHPFQVFPTAWVQAAFDRWTPEPPHRIPMTAIACDPAQGGDDRLVIGARFDWWFARQIVIPGKSVSFGRDSAGYIVTNRRDNAIIAVDMGGGYGSGIYECLRDNIEEKDFVAYNGAHESTGRTLDGKLGFINKRAESHWKFREALDPGQPSGSPIALPPDSELMQELAAITYEVTPRGIKVTAKDSPEPGADCIRHRIGRSPDKSDTVVIAWSVGDRLIPKGQPYSRRRRGSTQPKVNLGPRRRTT
jgi:hypothetical protein